MRSALNKVATGCNLGQSNWMDGKYDGTANLLNWADFNTYINTKVALPCAFRPGYLNRSIVVTAQRLQLSLHRSRTSVGI